MHRHTDKLSTWDDAAHQRVEAEVLVVSAIVAIDVVVVLESLAVLHQREHRLEPHVLHHRVPQGQSRQHPRLHPLGTVIWRWLLLQHTLFAKGNFSRYKW